MNHWDKFLNDQEPLFGKATVENWLRSLRVIKFDACNLYLEADSDFQYDWFEEHFRETVKRSFHNENHRPIEVHLTIREDAAKKSTKQKIPTNPYASDALSPNYSYDQFIISPDNEITFTIFSQLSGYSHVPSTLSSSELQFNPIYLYGQGACGKTHLLTSAAKTFLAQGKKTLFVSGKTLSKHIVDAIRKNNLHQLRNTYRHVDVLIIDGVEELSNKYASQEEFFHTFNHLHVSGKQIIIGSDTPSRLLKSMEERLISRFEWGIVLQLQELKEKVYLKELLKKRIDFYRVKLTKESEEYFLRTFTTAEQLVRAIEYTLLKRQLNSIDDRVCLSTKELKVILEPFIQNENSQKLSVEIILNKTAHAFGIKTEDILLKSQMQNNVLPRKIAMYFLRKNMQLPYMKIGSIFSKDHSTVISSIRSIEKKINEKDPSLLSNINEIDLLISNR